jgi:hypothetical protein
LILALALTSALPVDVAAEVVQVEGSVCIATFSDKDRNTFPEQGGPRPRNEVTYAFAVQFDNGGRIPIPSADPVSVALTTGQRHLVRIFDGDRQIESFHFTFDARKSAHLCLSYDDYYQTWGLEPIVPRAKWCRCETPAIPPG